MKLKTTQQKETEIDVPIPSFYREPDPHNLGTISMLAIIDKNTICTVYENKELTLVANYALWLKEYDIVKAYQNWVEITENEFLVAYERALTSMSLTPQLVK